MDEPQPPSSLRLSHFPREILENIAIELVLLSPTERPKDLAQFSATCSRLRATLWHSHWIRARIFRTIFDSSAAVRRLGSRAKSPRNIADQLSVYYLTLAEIRHGDVYTPHVQQVFWRAFLMLLENDGKNRVQLADAGLDDFVENFVLERLWEGSEDNGGYPLDNIVNSLALWIMAMIAVPQRLASETAERRQAIINRVLPYVLLPFRYPTAFIPANHYRIPFSAILDETYPTSFESTHGPYPVYRLHSDPDVVESPGSGITHYGCTFEICAPLITIAAKHIFFARRELVPLPIPPHLPPFRSSVHGAHVGMTQEDIRSFNRHKGTRLFEPSRWDWWSMNGANEHEPPSMKWDSDWERLVSCWDPWSEPFFRGPVYPLGALDGLWVGRMIVPSVHALMHVLSAPSIPQHFSEYAMGLTTQPLYMRLKEHHCVSPRSPIRSGEDREHGFDDGLADGWFPPRVRMRADEQEGFVCLQDADAGESHLYETYAPGRHNTHDPDTCESCIKREIKLTAHRRTRMDVDMAHGMDVGVDFNPEVTGNDADYESYFAAIGLGRNEYSTRQDDNCDDISDDDDNGHENSFKFGAGHGHDCNGVVDIIITGSTDPTHGLAWGSYSYAGRVRPWDGLICMLRVPSPQTLSPGAAPLPSAMGRPWVFTGYLLGGGQCVIGSWRICSVDGQGDDPAVGVELPGWECAWVMSRLERED